MGLSSSDSETSQEGQFNQEVWGGQAPYLQNMYRQFNSLFPSMLGGMRGLMPGAVGGAQGVYEGSVPAWQDQMAGGAYGNLPLDQMYQDALQGGGAEQDINEMIMGGAGNDYVDAMKTQMQSDAFSNLDQTLKRYDQRFAGNNLDSSRRDLLYADATEDALDALQRAQTGLGYQTFDTDLDRKLGIAQRADAFDKARLGSIENALAGKQAAQQGGLGFGANLQNLNMGQFAPYMMPWQMAGAYANAMGAPVVLGSGSTFGAGESDSSGISFK